MTPVAPLNLGFIEEMTSYSKVNNGTNMFTLFGLKTCDTCRKAFKELEKNGDAGFRDVRSDPLSRDQVEQFHASFGDALINRRSTTWRALSDEERARDPIDLILDHPTLMKRPVVFSDSGLTLGWDAKAKAVHLGT